MATGSAPLTTTCHAYVGKLRITCISDLDENGYDLLDTAVKIEGGHLCVVAGSQRNEFLDELAALVGKYEI